MASKLVTTIKSTFGSIHLSEAWKSVITGFISAALFGLITLVDNGKHIPTFHEVWLLLWAAFCATLGNIGRIFFSNSQGQFLKGEKAAITTAP
jgi:hypothetical protein